MPALPSAEELPKLVRVNLNSSQLQAIIAMTDSYARGYIGHLQSKLYEGISKEDSQAIVNDGLLFAQAKLDLDYILYGLLEIAERRDALGQPEPFEVLLMEHEHTFIFATFKQATPNPEKIKQFSPDVVERAQKLIDETRTQLAAAVPMTETEVQTFLDSRKALIEDQQKADKLASELAGFFVQNKTGLA